jgi:hypothetical protein
VDSPDQGTIAEVAGSVSFEIMSAAATRPNAKAGTLAVIRTKAVRGDLFLVSPRSALLFAVLARCLVEEPDATLGFVDPILDQARGRNIAIVVANGVGGSQADR